MTNKITTEDPMWWTMYALFAPTIVWQGQEEHVNDQIKSKVRLERFMKAAGDHSESATDAEVALYLMTATADRPLNEEAYKVYRYAAAKAFPEIKKALSGIPESKDIDKLTPEEQKHYDDLAKWIFKQQKKALAEKLDEASAKDTKEPPQDNRMKS